MRGLLGLAALAPFIASCSGANDITELSIDSTWQWQLQGGVNTFYDVDVYDIDLFDVPSETIDSLRRDGRYVVCYFSAGSWEQWRDDADRFDTDAIGEPLDGWEGERWFDIRSQDARAVLADRLDLAAAKGCQGVEPDNVTGFENDSGFDLTAGDQLDFNRFLATEAHDRGLTIGLKNDLSQIPELVADFDFAVNEQCHEFDECDALQPFIEADKPTFNAEYLDEFVDDPGPVCADADSLGIATLIMPLALDDEFRISC